MSQQSRFARLGVESLESREVPAAVGALDPSFGVGGAVVTNVGIGGSAAAVAVQGDGKIVSAGTTGLIPDFAVSRLNPDGTADTTFGGNGHQLYDFGGKDFATAVAVQADGKIVVAGFTNAKNVNDFAVLRLLPDGTPDTGFGPNGNGKLTVDFSADDRAWAVAIRPDGRIVVGGSWDGGQSDFAVVQLTPAGALDPTFGGGFYGPGSGKTNVTFGASQFVGKDYMRGLALQPDGQIVAVGYTDQGGVKYNFGITRIKADGSGLDTTFGPRGS